MDDKILLQELVKKSLLSSELAQEILKESGLAQKKAETLLYERRLIDQIAVAEIKSELSGIPYQKVNIGAIDEKLLSLIPEEVSRNYQVAPLERTADMLILGMVQPDDAKAQDALKFTAKKLAVNLGVYIITPSDLELIWRKYSPFKTEIEAALKGIQVKPGGRTLAAEQRIVRLEEGVSLSEEAPVIKIVASALKEAVEKGASDIHIEPQRTRLRIRFRMDGELQEVSSLPLELHQPIVSRIKVLANLKIDENRVPQDGRFRTIIFNKEIDFRVATFPTATGEKAALRVLDPSVGLRGLAELGLSGYNGKTLEAAIKRPFGMILITGPTGSGKTTTLYAIFQVLNKEGVNVVSLEDPVEYTIDGVNQSQVRPEIGYDFASGLRQIVRQDPDVIMVGEIRDSETAALAIHAALTGHIVLSTLHTNNAIGVIPRLIDMKAEPYLLPPSLNLMVAQRLVSRLCPDCKKAVAPPQEVQKIIKKELDSLPSSFSGQEKFKEPFQIFHSQGCKTCKNKGVFGRVAIFEMFSMTSELAEIITTAPSEVKIAEEAKRQGMITLRQDGILKALEGLISIEEVLRETAEMV